MNMKKILMAVLVSLVAFTACENYGDDNHKVRQCRIPRRRFDERRTAHDLQQHPGYDCALQAVLTYPAGQDVAVTLTVDPSLVAAYNARYGTEWQMLDSKILFLCCPKL